LLLAAAVAVLAAVALLEQSQAGAQPLSKARPLVTMRRNDGQVFQTISIQPTGRGEVGFFIGELTGTHYAAFRLSATRLDHLRQLIDAVGSLHRNLYVNPSSSALPFVADIQYVVSLRSRTFVTDAGYEPRSLKSLTAQLAALIDGHARAASTSSRTKP
jgi:hypothetical protein